MNDEKWTKSAGRQTPVRILDAAERIFAKSGYSGASTRMIADAAKANIGLIAYYFGSKEGLFEAVVARRAEGLMHRINQSINQNDDPSANLSRLLAETAAYLAKEQVAFLVIAVRESLGSEASPLSEVVAAHLAPHRERLAAVLRAGIRDESFRSIDPSAFYTATIGVLAAAAGWPSMRPGPAANRIEETLELLITGVQRASLPAPPAAEPDPPSSRSVSTTNYQDEDPFEIGIFD